MEESTSTVGSAAVSEQLSPAAALVRPRRLAINFLYLSGGELAAKLLTFASFSYLARILGPSGYGIVEFTLAVMVFFSLPIDWGLSWYGAREIAREPGRATRLLHDVTGLRVYLTLLSMLGLGIFILLLNKGSELKALLALYGLSLLAGPFLTQWFFQAHDQMYWVGIASIVRQTGFAGLIFLACRRGTSLVYIGGFECVSVTIVAVYCLYVVRYKMRFDWPWPDLRLTRLLGHLREAAPIGLNELAWASMWYFCTVLLGFLFTDFSLGWFGASHRVLMALHTFVYLYFFNLLPSMSRCVLLPKEKLLELMDRSVRFAAWTGLFAAGLLTAVAPQLLTAVYGPSFKGASHSFVILVWMLPVAMLSGHHRYILIAYSCQKRLLYCTSLSAAAAVVLGFALVPLYNGPGAAWAVLIANIINFALVYVSVRQLIVEVPVHRQLTMPLSALALSMVFYFAFAKWNVWIAAAGGLVCYIVGLACSDGRQLAGFLQTIFRKSGTITEAKI